MSTRYILHASGHNNEWSRFNLPSSQHAATREAEEIHFCKHHVTMQRVVTAGTWTCTAWSLALLTLSADSSDRTCMCDIMWYSQQSEHRVSNCEFTTRVQIENRDRAIVMRNGVLNRAHPRCALCDLSNSSNAWMATLFEQSCTSQMKQHCKYSRLRKQTQLHGLHSNDRPLSSNMFQEKTPRTNWW